METYDQGYGCILYRTQVPAGPAGRIQAGAVHDFGYVFLDGQRLAILDRRSRQDSFELPKRAKPATLDILVEPMGRVNFGSEVADHKGLGAPVKLVSGQQDAVELEHWKIFKLPLDQAMLSGLRFGPATANLPAFWRGTFNLDGTGDTFLDLRPWGKGLVWVNGHCLARFWNVGPTQTAYLPGPWLKKGENEIIILDYLGPQKPVVAGLAQPILDQLRPELDFARARKRPQVMQVDAAQPTHTGSFAPGTALQEVNFSRPATGRYFEIESLSAQDGKPYDAIAELSLLGPEGSPLGAEGWTIASVDSEETEKEDGSAANAIDGQTTSYWHTQWGSASPDHPHLLVIDLGRTQTIAGFRYTPRQGAPGVGGRIKDYRVFIGDTLKPYVASKPRASLRIKGPPALAAGGVYLFNIVVHLLNSGSGPAACQLSVADGSLDSAGVRMTTPLASDVDCSTPVFVLRRAGNGTSLSGTVPADSLASLVLSCSPQ